MPTSAFCIIATSFAPSPIAREIALVCSRTYAEIFSQRYDTFASLDANKYEIESIMGKKIVCDGDTYGRHGHIADLAEIYSTG